MKPWERRLKDLAIILEACHKNYFDPELFRLNINQFLQTSRTVTFIIQKNKDSIPNFDVWYEKETCEWRENKILLWAKDSRNTIEKVGDIALNSSIAVSLINSYLEMYDTKLEIKESKYIYITIDKIYKHLKTELKYISDEEWAIKVERRWVANSLPNEELLWVLSFIYFSQYKICVSACLQIGSFISTEIKEPLELDSTILDSRYVRYLVEGQEFKSLSTKHVSRDPNFVSDMGLLNDQRSRFLSINSFESCIDIMAKNAAELFERDGIHVPMLMVFNSKMDVIDFITPYLGNKADKFIFWRDIAARISSQNPYCVVYISEAWLKENPSNKSEYYPVSSLKTIGEMLQIIGVTNEGKCLDISYIIERDIFEKPMLKEGKSIHGDNKDVPFFLMPIKEAISVSRIRKS